MKTGAIFLMVSYRISPQIRLCVQFSLICCFPSSFFLFNSGFHDTNYLRDELNYNQSLFISGSFDL